MAGGGGLLDIAGRSSAEGGLLLRCLPVDLERRVRAPEGLRPEDIAAITAHLARLRAALVASAPRWLVPELLAGARAPALSLDASVLFADVSGFTALSERLSAFGEAGKEHITRALNRCFDALVGAALAHGGDLLAFGGDAVLLCFSGPEHAAVAAAAAQAMQSAMAEVNALSVGGRPLALSVKIGLASGPVLLADAGTADRRIALALGRVLDLSDEQTTRTRPGEIRLDPSTISLLGGAAQIEPQPDGSALLINAPPAPGAGAGAPAPLPAGAIDSLLDQIGALAPYMPPDVFADLAADPTIRPGEGEQREVVSLFIHIAGLHALADSLGPAHPAEAAALIGEPIEAAMATIEQHGGVLAHADIYSGGLKLLAFFGAPVARERDALRAVQAALRLRDRLPSAAAGLAARLPSPLQARLGVRMGINAGQVIAGLIGVPERWEYTVIGSATNVAARLMAAGSLERGEILVGPSVRRQLASEISGEPRSLSLKGLSAPVEALALADVSAAPWLEPSVSSPLVGRDSELARLSGAAAAIEQGDSRLIFLQGEAGVGKSRLARELAGQLGDRLTCLITASPGVVPPSFAIFRSLVAELASMLGLPPAPAGERAGALLVDLCPEQAADLWPALAVLLDLPAADPTLLGESPADQQGALARVIRALLLAAAARQPMVWVCEDLHEADNASLDLLEQLLSMGGMQRLLLCTMIRPPAAADAQAHPLMRVIEAARATYGARVELLSLEGLDEAAGTALLGALIPGLDAEARAAILAHTGGNPLFIELLVQSLRQQGDLQPGPRGVTLRGSLDHLKVPGTLRELVRAQVDQLPPEARRLGQAAAVIAAGARELPRWLIEHISDEPPLVVAARLGELEQARLLERLPPPGEPRYRFRHALFQQIAYSRLLESRRVELHRRAGRALHALGPAGAQVESLAYHCYEGQDWELALDYVLAAGRRAREIYANREARRQLRRALGLARRLGRPPFAAAAREELGALNALLGRYDPARAQLERALSAGADAESTARRHRLLALVAERTGDYERAAGHCRAGLALAERPGLPPREAALLHARLADVLLRRGDFAAAEAACRAGLAILGDDAPSRERVALIQRLATLDGQRGHYAAAAAALEQSLPLARQAGDPALTGAVLNNIGIYLYHLGRHQEALRYYEESLDLKAQIGDIDGRAKTLANLGLLQLSLGDSAAALRSYEEALALSVRHGLASSVAYLTMNIGRLHYEEGRLEQAERSLAEARATYAGLDDADNLAGCLYVMGDVAIARGRPGEARAYGEQSLALARQVGSAVYESCARRVIGEALTLEGRYGEAAGQLAQAQALQDQIGDPFDSALILAARARLAQAQGQRAAAATLAAEALALAREQQVAYLVAALERLLEG